MRKRHIGKARRSASIQRQIFSAYSRLLLGLMAAVLIAVGVILIHSTRRRVERDQQRELLILRNSVDEALGNLISSVTALSADARIQSLLTRFSNVPPAQRYLNAGDQQALAAYSYLAHNAVVSWDIIDTNGTLMGLSPYNGIEIQQYVADELAAQFPLPNRVHLQGPFPMHVPSSVGEARTVFLAFKPVFALNTGEYLGTFVAYVNEQRIHDVYTQDVPAGDALLFLTDRADTILSSSVAGAVSQSLSAYLTPAGAALRDCVKLDGRLYFLYEAPLTAYSWKLHLAVPLETILSNVLVTLPVLLLIAAAGTAVSLLLSLLIARHITEPVKQLTQIMQRIEHDQSRLRAPVEGADEIAVLCTQFNHLMDTTEALAAKNAEAMELTLEYRLRLLQAQIQPHFLYNALETILSMIQLRLYGEAQEAVMQLAGFYRLSLSEGQDIIPLAQELELTECYLGIQSKRYAEFFDYDVQCAADLSDYRIPKLTLQPLVENAIYHGIKPKGGGHISVAVTARADGLQIAVEDNGVGIPAARLAALLDPAAARSYGLRNIATRLELFSAGRCTLRVESAEHSYTKVLIDLPRWEDHDPRTAG